MTLLKGDIILHLYQQPGKPSFGLSHAMLYVSENKIAHSIFNNHQRGVRLHDIERYINSKNIHPENNDILLVFRPKQALAKTLAQLALSFAIDSSTARDFITYKNENDQKYSIELNGLRSNFMKNGVAHVRYQHLVGAPLPTPYVIPRRIDIGEAQNDLMLTINYLRAMRTAYRAKQPASYQWMNQQNEPVTTRILSHNKGMTCTDFVMYITLASIYTNDVEESFKNQVKPITDQIWKLRQRGYKLKEQITAANYYQASEHKPMHISTPPRVPKTDNIHKLHAKLLQQQANNPSLKIFNHAWRGHANTLLTDFFIPLTSFNDVNQTNVLFDLYQLTWPSLYLIPIRKKPQISTLKNLSYPWDFLAWLRHQIL